MGAGLPYRLVASKSGLSTERVLGSTRGAVALASGSKSRAARCLPHRPAFPSLVRMGPVPQVLTRVAPYGLLPQRSAVAKSRFLYTVDPSS